MVNSLTSEYIFLVEHPKFGFVIKTETFFLIEKVLIKLFDFKIKFFEYIPNLTSDPIKFVILILSLFETLINFFLKKKFKKTNYCIDAAPRPDFNGIFFFMIILYLSFKSFFLLIILNN